MQRHPRATKEPRYNKCMTIELTNSDKAYARQHGLTFGEMREFVEDQIKEEEMVKTYYEQQKKDHEDFKNSPQAIYAAW